MVKRAKKRLGVKTSDDVELPPELVQRADQAQQGHGRRERQVVQLHDGRKAGEWCVLKGCTGRFCRRPAHRHPGALRVRQDHSMLGSITGIGHGPRPVDVLERGYPHQRASRALAHQVAYVPQADHLIPTLTVRECVKYSALLRLPRDMSPEELNDRVESVLRELGISHIGDSQVGGSGKIRGVSGGERRRVTIAMELVTDPSIIVLDEPTSGLDSFTALSLLKVLGQVAKGGGGRVVIASLHQPSKDMFFGLDKVILMGHGRMLYQGKPETASQYLAAAGCPGNRSHARRRAHARGGQQPGEHRQDAPRRRSSPTPPPGRTSPVGSPEKVRSADAKLADSTRLDALQGANVAPTPPTSSVPSSPEARTATSRS